MVHTEKRDGHGGEARHAHTPGPWYFEVEEAVTRSPWTMQGLIVSADNRRIAEIFGYGSSLPWAANAHLIAAAPELLAALNFILAFYEPGQRYLDTEAWKCAEASARAAIAKATEGQS